MAGRSFPKPRVSNSYADFPPYFREWLDNHKVLPDSEQMKMLDDYNKTGDIELLNNFLLQFVLLIAKNCYSFLGYGIPKTDLFQEGFLRLYKGTEKFDPSLGIKFSTYVKNWVKEGMQKTLQRQRQVVPMPAHIHVAIVQIYRAEIRLFQKGIENPTDEEILEEIKEEKKDKDKLRNIKSALKYRIRSIISFESPHTNSQLPFEEGLPLKDIMPDRSTLDDSENLIATREEFIRCCVRIQKTIKKASRIFGPRNAQILALRYGLDGTFEGKSMRTLAEKFKVSWQRIEQIEKKTLNHLKLVAIDPKTHEKRNLFAIEISKLEYLCELIEVKDPWNIAEKIIFYPQKV